ncbi:MAG: serine hydrolase domain-containing protein [Acidimicrobiales bacterium]
MDDAVLAPLVADWPGAPVAVGVTSASGLVACCGPVETGFELASVTKLLVAMACWVAAEEETLAFDQPAGPPGSTVAHLLAHASGLDPDRARPIAPVGTRRIYSNAGYEVLGETLAAAAHLDVATYLREAVLEPLGCAQTALAGSAAHGARGSVMDLLRVGRELLAPTLIDQSTWQRVTGPAFPDLSGVLPGFGRHDPNPWGLGPEIRANKAPHWTGTTNSPATFGHFGRSGAFLWVDPVAGLAVALAGDRPFDMWCTKAWPALSDAIVAHGAPLPDRSMQVPRTPDQPGVTAVSSSSVSAWPIGTAMRNGPPD